jgi:hypothetical protein
VLPLALTQWVPTSGALQCVVDFSLADIAGVGTGGAAVAGVVATVGVRGHYSGGISVGKFGRAAAVADVYDAAGNRLSGTGIVWTSSDPTNAPVWATPDPAVAIVGNPNGVTATKTITATIGAVSGNASAFLIG